MQAPLTQLIPPAHAGLQEVAQVPAATQDPLQSSVPAGQEQALAAHTLPPAQRLPQPLQLAASLARSVQAPLQSTCPGGQTQLPLSQTWPPVQAGSQTTGQAVPITQVPPQFTEPGGQVQAPPTQVWSPAHTFPQDPQ